MVKLPHLLKKEEGIALVTSLLLTLISMTIVMAAMYLMSLATVQSGKSKRYKTALEASYGGNDMIMKDLIPQMLLKQDSATLLTDVPAQFGGGSNLVIGPDYSSDPERLNCIKAKLQNDTANWNTAAALCTAAPTAMRSLKPKELPDFRFSVPSYDAGHPYTVYSKITDTSTGNSDMSGVNLLGAGVADSQNGIVPQHIPYVFRVEVQAESSNNPAGEKANLSVLYAY